MIIRPMERDDLEAWTGMRLALWPDHAGEDMRAWTLDFFDGTSPFVTTAFIACADDGAPLGFIELNLRPYAEGSTSSPVPHIEGWYVAPDARRNGVGSALMAAAEQWARDRGYRELTSDTNEDYPLSLAAHGKNGFEVVERLIALRKPLV